jgi:hypothetical protein
MAGGGAAGAMTNRPEARASFLASRARVSAIAVSILRRLPGRSFFMVNIGRPCSSLGRGEAPVGIRPVAAGDRMPVVGQPGIFDQLLTDFATWSRGEDVSLPTYPGLR